jgi:outer membrane protein assembly factor BamB
MPTVAHAGSIFVLAVLIGGCGTTVPPSPAERASATPAPKGDVLAYRGDSQRAGVMPGPAPSGQPTVAWTFQATAPIATSPIVVGPNAIVVASDGIVHALDLGTGAERWNTALGAPIGSATPAVIDGRIVIGDRHGVLHVVDAATGAPVLTKALDGPIGGSVVVVGDRIFAATEHGTAYAVDPVTLEIRWQKKLAGGVAKSLAASADTLLLGVTGGILQAVALDDGALRWQATLATDGAIGTPSVVDGLVFAATGLDGEDPAAKGLVALDATTGVVRWRYGSPQQDQVYTPAVATGRAYVIGEDSTVVALDAASGTSVWSITMKQPLEALPAIVGDALIIASNSGVVAALDRADGTVRWTTAIVGVPYAPIVTHGLVLVGTSTGTLYAIGSYAP